MFSRYLVKDLSCGHVQSTHPAVTKGHSSVSNPSLHKTSVRHPDSIHQSSLKTLKILVSNFSKHNVDKTKQKKMHSKLKWKLQVKPKKQSETRTIWDICFSPDGSQIVVAATSRVLVYNGDDRSLIKSLRGHTGAVYAVCYARDGKRFASGGADNHIIIWTSECEGLLKYSHNDPIQSLSYNSTTNAL